MFLYSGLDESFFVEHVTSHTHTHTHTHTHIYIERSVAKSELEAQVLLIFDTDYAGYSTAILRNQNAGPVGQRKNKTRFKCFQIKISWSLLIPKMIRDTVQNDTWYCSKWYVILFKMIRDTVQNDTWYCSKWYVILFKMIRDTVQNQFRYRNTCSVYRGPTRPLVGSSH
jgi:hypothetical protein